MQLEFISVFGIITGVIARFWPVWIALAVIMVPSYVYKKKLGLYGQLYDSGVGIAGLLICLFWLFTAIFASTISPFNPLQQLVVMKDALPGAIDPDTHKVFLFGGDSEGGGQQPQRQQQATRDEGRGTHAGFPLAKWRT